jgi:hypothetical protein
MNREEAKQILALTASGLRKRSYRELCRLLDSCEYQEVIGPSQTSYQLQVLAVWDDKPNHNLRVFMGITDGRGWSTIFPLTECFIMAPDGSFVGE